MGIGEKIQQARREAGLTQEQLAAKVYVTRQAVSRWETGESEPGIDMRKLLARVLGVPVAQLLDLPDTPTCQCCGTPFDVPNMPLGTNADGTENPDYCGWCYQGGEFTGDDLDEIIEYNVPYLVQATGCSAEEAVSFMGALLPTLKRWREAENRNRAADLRKGAFYVCPDCANVVWSSGEAAVSCCGNALEPLQANCNAGALDATVEVADGCQRVEIAHPMTKDDHLLFLLRLATTWPESSASTPNRRREPSSPCKGRASSMPTGAPAAWSSFRALESPCP